MDAYNDLEYKFNISSTKDATFSENQLNTI